MLWLQVLFWSVLIAGAITAWLKLEVSQALILRTFLPVTMKAYWYMTAYFVVELVAPLVNWLIGRGNGFLVCFYIIAVVTVSVIITTSGNNAVWLLLCYMGGALIKKYEKYFNIKPYKGMMGYTLCVVLTWAGQFLDSGAGVRIPGIVRSIWRGRLDGLWPSALTMYIAALFLLVWAKELRVPEAWKPVLGQVVPLQLSVYLITVHPLVWKYIFDDAFGILAGNVFTVLIGVPLCTAMVNLFCMILDRFRQRLFQRIL